METGGDRKRFRFFQRHISWQALAIGVLGAAAFGAALLYTAGSAQAKPVAVPGIGVIEIPNEIVGTFDFGPMAVPGVGTTHTPNLVEVPNEESGLAAIPEPVQGHSQPAVPAFEAAPGVLTIPESAQAFLPEPTPAAAAPMPEPVAPHADSRSITIAGLGTFAVPAGMAAPLVAIPGIAETPAPMMAPKQQSKGERAVEAARSKLGTSYSMGSNGPDSFDCSGLVQWSYREAGVDLPRTSYGQLATGTPVGLDELQPGDMVSYYGGGHSALYAGEGRIIHASTYGVGVTESSLQEMSVTGARRY